MPLIVFSPQQLTSMSAIRYVLWDWARVKNAHRLMPNPMVGNGYVTFFRIFSSVVIYREPWWQLLPPLTLFSGQRIKHSLKHGGEVSHATGVMATLEANSCHELLLGGRKKWLKHWDAIDDKIRKSQFYCVCVTTSSWLLWKLDYGISFALKALSTWLLPNSVEFVILVYFFKFYVKYSFVNFSYISRLTSSLD